VGKKGAWSFEPFEKEPEETSAFLSQLYRQHRGTVAPLSLARAEKGFRAKGQGPWGRVSSVRPTL
jgi:hypothetical protein